MSAEKRYRELLDEARRLESTGNVKGALDRVRTALQKADDPHVVTTLEEHLRLPLLLQQAGHLEAARDAFDRLLDEGYSDQLDIPTVRWHERGLIYDAMRRAFNRSGRPAEAALYEGLSYLADAYGRFLDTHRADYEQHIRRFSRENAEAVAADLIAPLDDGPSREEVADVLHDAIRRFENAEGEDILGEVEKELCRLLEIGDS